VIDYETFSKIHDCHDRQGLTIAQTARAVGLHWRTVAKWLARSRFERRRSKPRASILIPSNRGSRGCSTLIPTVRGKFSSVCARSVTAVA
jgi:hypothetical protein